MNATDREAVRERIAGVAADWIVRHDRGLAPQEEADFQAWLAAAPEHAAVFAERRRLWASFDAVAEQPVAVTTNVGWRSRLWIWAVPAGLATAMAALVAWTPRIREIQPLAPAAPTLALAALVPAERRFLADGSIIDLGPDAIVEIDVVASERRVRLRRGAAHFQVARDAARPFVVSTAAGVEVHVLGTRFDVWLGAAQVDVRVASGQVQVRRPGAPGAGATTIPVLGGGQRVVVPLAAEAASGVVEAAPIPAPAQPVAPLRYEFERTPLGRAVAEINRRSTVRVTVEDPELVQLPIYASFRADNVDAFVRLLEATGEIRAERAADTIALRRVR